MITWETVRLGNISSIKGGKRLPAGTSLIKNVNSHPYIRVRDLNNVSTIEITNEFEYVDDQTYKKIARYTVSEGDIILSIVGTIGLVAVVGETLDKANLTENCVKITKLAEEYNKKFIFYYLCSPRGQNEIRKGIVGAVQAKLPLKNISAIEIPMMPIDKQERIAKVLSSIDDKIELNTKINHNLEEQAKGLYVKYFPYSIEDDLPNGWRRGRLDEIIELHDSKRVPLSNNERARMNKIYPYYGAASLMDYVNDYLFDGIFLLLGEDGTVVSGDGFPVLQYVWGKFWVNNHAHILTGKSGFSVECLLLLLKRTPVKAIVTGAVQPKISQANLKSIPVIVPPERLLQDFNDNIAPLFALIRQNQEESRCLEQLRDSLLPKLMSGEIDVSEVEV